MKSYARLNSWYIIAAFTIILLAILFRTIVLNASEEGLNLEYTVTIDDPSNHLLKVKLEVDNIVTETLKLTRQSPYQTNPPIINLSIRNSLGSILSYNIDSSSSGYETFVVNTEAINALVVEYDVDLTFFGNDQSPFHSYWNLDSLYGAVESQVVLIQPIIDSTISECILYDALPTGWKLISRLTNRGSYHEANTDDIVTHYIPPKPLNFILWGPMLFGDFNEYLRIIGGVEFDISFFGNEYIQGQIADNLFSIFQYFSENVGPLNYPKNSDYPIRYIYSLLYETTRNVHCGDHIYGQFTLRNEFNNYLIYRGDSHMIAHTWFSHFGLLSDVVYVDFWISEGIIQYYALKSLQDTAIWTPAEVNEHLSGWYDDYKNYILGTQYDVPIYPESGWFDFPDEQLPGTFYSYGIKRLLIFEKAPLVFWILDNQIRKFTSGKKGFNDVWKFFHKNYPANFLKPISYDEMLRVCNGISEKDFTNLFQAYVSGNDPLPFYVENSILKIDNMKLPEIEDLSSLDIFKFKLKWENEGPDNDGDGFSDEFERTIGTNPNSADTDADGLPDRAEYGVIIDGNEDELRFDQPLLQDSQGDSKSTENGADIKDIYARIFLDENDSNHLYMAISTWGKEYNKDAWYEIYLMVSNDFYQYRYDNGISYLWHKENGNHVSIGDDKVESKFTDLLEVKIPLELIGNPESLTIRAIIRLGNMDNPEDVDWTSDISVPFQPRIFITDPINPDTDEDGANDGNEVQNGFDPTDPNSYPIGGKKASVTEDAVTSIACCSAMLRGDINPNGIAAYAAFQYGIDNNYGDVENAIQGQITGNIYQKVNANLNGLKPGTEYHFRLRASNSNWTAYGTDTTFTTLSLAPNVKTSSSQLITASSAKFYGDVNPHGQDTKYYFQYGIDTNYGENSPLEDAGSDDKPISVSANISELSPNTIYHYRIVAANNEGTSSGQDETLNTTILYVDSAGTCNTNLPCYSNIKDAVDAAKSGVTIRIFQGKYNESLELSLSKEILLSGGWDEQFSINSGSTIIIGDSSPAASIQSATLVLENIVLQ